MVQTFVNSDNLTSAVNTLDKVIKTVDTLIEKFGVLKTTIVALTAVKLGKNIGVFKELGNAYSAVQSTILNASNIGDGVAYTNQLASSVKNLTAQQQALILSSNGLNQARVYEILKTNELTDAEIAQAMATLSLSTSTKELTVADVEGMLAAQLGNTERAKAIMTQLGLVGAQETGIVSTANLTREEVILTLTQQGLTTAQAEGIATQLGLTASMSGLSLAFKGAALSAKSLLATLGAFVASNPIILGIAAATAALFALHKINKKQQEADDKRFKKIKDNIEKFKEETDEIKEQSSELKNIIDRYKELAQKSQLTIEEKEELVELQDKLNDSYGEEGKSIDLINGKYDEQLKKLKELNREKTKDQYTATNALRMQYEKAKDTNKENNIFTPEIDSAEIDKTTNEMYESLYDVWKNIEGVTIGLHGVFVSSELSSEEKVKVLNQMIEGLRNNTTKSQKETESYVLLLGRLTSLMKSYQTEVDNYSSALAEEAELAVSIFESDGINFENVTADTYKAWVTSLINEYAKDDPDLRDAIYDYLRRTYDDSFRLASMSAADLAYYWANKAKEDAEKAFKSVFDISQWAEDNDISGLEGRMEKLRTAYGKLEDGKSGFSLGQSFFKDFPNLAVYANDTKKLREEMEKAAKVETSQLIAQLSSQLTKTSDPATRSSLQTAIKLLQDMANLTEETAENYSKQKEIIKKNIHNLEDQIKATERLKEAEEKRKEALEKQKKALEDQKKNLEKQRKAVEKSYQTQIDALDEEIDRLKDEADAQERINDLKEKELALEKAKNTKVRQYSASRGWTVSVDSEAVKAAQKEYDDALKEKQTDDLERQKKELEKQKDLALESYDNQIENIEDQIEAYDARIDKIDEQIDKYDEEIDKYQSLKDEQKSYLSFYKSYSSDFATATEDQTKALDNLNKALKDYRDLSELPKIKELYDKAMEKFAPDYEGYAQGGVVNYDGIAKLHGAKSSELILNNRDVGKIYDMIHGSTSGQLINTMAQNYLKQAASSTDNLERADKSISNSYTWQLSGNNIIVDSYEKFKGYMDRYVREAKQDLAVGR